MTIVILCFLKYYNQFEQGVTLITNHKYDSQLKLMEVFQKFGRANWQKKTMWGIKASEVRVMLCIKESSLQDARGTTVSDISKKLDVTSPTVTQMVNHLITADYVIRTTDTKDRRITYITLTDKGEQIAQKVANSYRDYFEGLIDYLGQEQSETLIHLLDQVFQYTKSNKKHQELE